jgi:hypothetical protein
VVGNETALSDYNVCTLKPFRGFSQIAATWYVFQMNKVASVFGVNWQDVTDLFDTLVVILILDKCDGKYVT